MATVTPLSIPCLVEGCSRPPSCATEQCWPVHIYLLTCFGTMTCVYVLKDRNWTAGVILGGLLVTAVASHFWLKPTPQQQEIVHQGQLARVDDLQSQIDDNIEAVIEGESEEKKELDELANRLKDKVVGANSILKAAPASHRNAEETLSIARNTTTILNRIKDDSSDGSRSVQSENPFEEIL